MVKKLNSSYVSRQRNL